jgi:endonuclease/exonuclease/phosphatase family metal-dependent hydrolase
MSKPLTFCEFNVENLFISLVYYEGEYLESITEEQWTGFALAQLQEKQKSLKKLRALASVFHEINADVFMLVEVGGEESLHHFNLHFLNDEYDCHFVAGNARRGIDLAFLTKKDLPFSAETHSNRDLVVEVSGWTGKQLTKFSRDIAELRLKDREGTLALTVLLTHLKSMLGSETDARGKDVRTAEAFALSELYEKRRKEHPNSPLLVCGDLNSNLSSLELERLRHLKHRFLTCTSLLTAPLTRMCSITF